MKKHYVKALIIVLFLVVAPVLLFGCKEEPKPVMAAPACTIPSGNLVEPAFDTARTTLSYPDCRYKFDQVFQALLDVCTGNPQKDNKKKFNDFLMWSLDRGLISRVQAEEYYTRYFSHVFISLPRDYQTCNYCSQLSEILSECKDELRDKERGLLRVSDDKSTFAKASGDFANIELILEASCSACKSE